MRATEDNTCKGTIVFFNLGGVYEPRIVLDDGELLNVNGESVGLIRSGHSNYEHPFKGDKIILEFDGKQWTEKVERLNKIRAHWSNVDVGDIVLDEDDIEYTVITLEGNYYVVNVEHNLLYRINEKTFYLT